MAWPRPGDTPESMYGFKDEAQLAKMKAIAPVVGVMQAGSALDVIRTNEKLAEAAGSGLTVLPGYGEDYYWEVLSWDIVHYSVRDSFTPEPLMEQPVFARLEAAQAGQLHPWKLKSMDYEAQTSYLGELAGWLASDQKVTT